MTTLRCGLALLPFAFALAACGSSGSGGDASDATDAGPKFDAVRDTPDAHGATDTGVTGPTDGSPTATSLTLITEPDQGIAPIYSFISSAKHTLDMTMYELTDTQVSTLLTTAAKSGVTVRVILDQNLEMKSNTPAYDALMAGGVQVHWADTIYAATHQKTITVDGTTSAIMTLNLVASDYATTRDFAVITNRSEDVAAIESTFEKDFTNAAVSPDLGADLVWSPTNSNTAIPGLISGAKTSLLIENEEMGDDQIVSALTSAASRGVAVEVVMTAAKDWDTNFATLVAAGVKVVTYKSSASLYIHAKVILADFGESDASVFIGSENFSDASLGANRELGLIVSDPAIMTSVHTTLSSDFAGGTAYP